MSGRRGMSLAMVLAVVTVMAVIATTMAAVSMMSLNYTQSWYNASIAQNEAEAGISELLYNVADDPEYGKDGQIIRARLTADMDDSQCYHVVTFAKDGKLPYSVNNLDGASPEGYGGRTVPSKMVHAWSIGYCRGMVRAIEVLVEKPPFPYALASSGRIRSSTPLSVEGVRSAAEVGAGNKPRPGHICSNSTAFDPADPSKSAIFIKADGTHPENRTFISGFAQAAGGIRIEDGVVVGGLKPRSSKVELPDIPVDGLRMKGSPGVITLGDAELPLPEGESTFVLDAMYDREGDLQLNGPVALKNAFLFVAGNLRIRGAVSGTGAIVCSGDVTVDGDAAIASANRVALLSGGRISLKGSGSYLQGIVYARKGVVAQKITVVGSMIVAGGPNDEASLDGVKMIGNRDTASISFQASSSTKVGGGNTSGRQGYFPVPLGGMYNSDTGGGYEPYIGVPPEYGNVGQYASYGDLRGWLPPEMVKVETIVYMFTAGGGANGTSDPNGRIASLKIGGLDLMPQDAAGIKAGLLELSSMAEQWKGIQEKVTTLQAAIDSMPEYVTQTITDPETGQTTTEQVKNPAREAKIAERDGLVSQQADIKKAYDSRVQGLAQEIVDYYKGHTGRNLEFNTPGKDIDVHHEFTFDIDKFISNGSRVRITYWHVYSHLP